MSLHLEFEPHSWYMGFAIKRTQTSTRVVGVRNHWEAFTDDGNTYRIDHLSSNRLDDLKYEIRAYHLNHHDGYGERYAAKRLKHLRGELRGEHISYGELAELQGLAAYIAPGDVELLEAAGIPEQV